MSYSLMKSLRGWEGSRRVICHYTWNYLLFVFRNVWNVEKIIFKHYFFLSVCMEFVESFFWCQSVCICKKKNRIIFYFLCSLKNADKKNAENQKNYVRSLYGKLLNKILCLEKNWIFSCLIMKEQIKIEHRNSLHYVRLCGNRIVKIDHY